MNFGEMKDLVQEQLDDSGVYRPDAFVEDSLNRGYQLTSYLALFDERRADVVLNRFFGTFRDLNFHGLPTTEPTGTPIAPLYVSQRSGKRIYPVSKVEEFEYYRDQWEGYQEATDTVTGQENAEYYMLLNPHYKEDARLVVVPVPQGYTAIVGGTLATICAYEPAAMSAETDEPRLVDDYRHMLVDYALFEAFVGEPGRATQAGQALRRYLETLQSLIQQLKARFPSGRDYEPKTLEFDSNVGSDYKLEQKETKDASK